MMRTIVAAVVMALASAIQQPSVDWPQFLGPSRDGTAPALPPDATLRVAWRAALLAGHSGIAVSGNRLVTMGSDGEHDFLVALDARSGKEIWRTALGASAGGNEPGSTPAIAGGTAIAVDSSCAVVAASLADGRIGWRRSLAQEYKSRFAAGGCAMSPLVAGARVLITTGAREGARLVSLDAATGATQWAADTLPNSLNGAPGFARFGEVPVALYHSAKPPGIGGISAVHAETGAVLWQADAPEGMSDTAPVLTPHGLLLQAWSGTTMLGPATQASPPKPLWTTKDLTAQWSPAIAHGGHLYGFGGNSGDFLLCVDAATGATRWSERIYRGHIARAGAVFVILSESSGLLRLVAPDPSGYREMHRMQVLTPGARTRTPPSIAGGRIFVRNLEEIVAVEAR